MNLLTYLQFPQNCATLSGYCVDVQMGQGQGHGETDIRQIHRPFLLIYISDHPKQIYVTP